VMGESWREVRGRAHFGVAHIVVKTLRDSTYVPARRNNTLMYL